MTLAQAVQVGQIGAVLVAAGSVAFAARAYWHGARLKRAEWLQRLYLQFYEQERYRDIRDLLDYRPERELNLLYDGLRHGKRSGLTDQLWDYLNFFEFVAGLQKLKQIRERDLKLLLQYPIERIAADEEIMDCLDREGFEHLDALLRERLPAWKAKMK
jgi:hypothetical protein